MPNIDITLTQELNVSLQAKPIANNSAWDMVYFVRDGETKTRFLGECIALNRDTKTITVRVQGTIPTPTAADFIFFVKDTEVGMSGISGYFAKVEMKNTSTSEAEIFAVGSDAVESSK